MKKVLLTVATGLLIGSFSFAQTVYDPQNFEVDFRGQSLTAITGLNKANATNGIVNVAQGDRYNGSDWAADGITYKIIFNNSSGKKNYQNVSFDFARWIGGNEDGSTTGNKFTKADGEAQNHDYVEGYTVDFTEPENRVVSFEAKANANGVPIRVDVCDLAGKTSNADNPHLNLSDEFVSYLFSWGGDQDGEADASIDIVQDMYSGDWHGIARPDDINSVAVDLKLTEISKIAITIYDGIEDDFTNVEVEIKNIQVGGGTTPKNVNVKTVSGNELKVIDGVIYSSGVITVTNIAGQVVKVANQSVSLASLPAGVLIISAAEGVAKIVK